MDRCATTPCLMYLGLSVDLLVKGPEQDLPEVKDAGVCVAGLDERLHEVVRNRRLVEVVAGHAAQRLLLPAPVLQHLGRSLHEVSLNIGSAEGITNKNTFQCAHAPRTWHLHFNSMFWELCCSCTISNKGHRENSRRKTNTTLGFKQRHGNCLVRAKSHKSQRHNRKHVTCQFSCDVCGISEALVDSREFRVSKAYNPPAETEIPSKCSPEQSEIGLRTDLMHHVAKLVEIRLHLKHQLERWSALCRATRRG